LVAGIIISVNSNDYHFLYQIQNSRDYLKLRELNFIIYNSSDTSCHTGLRL